jgi:predicted ATPase with chaperone activity
MDQSTTTHVAEYVPPPLPERLEDLDVSPGFLADLALKIVSSQGENTTASVSARLGLGMVITEALLQRLVQEKLIEVTGMVSLSNHSYAMLERGWEKVEYLMRLSNYIGGAPVSLETYSKMIVQQVRYRPPVRRAALDEALRGLVLSEETRETLFLVVSSGRSLFLTGPPGNGKTAMARALVNAIPGYLWIPHAIEVDGQVLCVFDKHSHEPVEVSGDENIDRRLIKIRPPLVVAGGDLTLENLELSITDSPRFYDAPFQVKSNGGVLVVDDLGRQRCSPRKLLNRWIIPLEYHVDYLTLSTGKKIEVPFEQIVVFATNLSGGNLEDEAFLRRMGYRMKVAPPSDEVYTKIFQQYAQMREVEVPPTLIPYALEKYRAEQRTPKCCDPRDLIERMLERCRARKKTPGLSERGLDAVWNSYFGANGT